MALWNASSASFASTWASAWSWKLRSRSGWSKRIAWNWKRHWFEAVFVPTWRWWTSNAAGWQEHRPAFMGDTENANPWHMWGKQGGKHPSDWAPKAVNNGMIIGPSYSILVLAKWSIAKCSTRSDPCMVNFRYFQCKDESDLFSRCFEYPARACHITQESQRRRWMFVTAVLTNFGIVPNPLTAFFKFQLRHSEVQDGVPQSYLSCFQNLDLTFEVKAESNMAFSFEDARRSSGAVRTWCPKKVEAQRGRQQL